MYHALLALLLCSTPQPAPLPDPTPDEPPPEPPPEPRVFNGIDWAYGVGDDFVFVTGDGRLVPGRPLPAGPVAYNSPVVARTVKADLRSVPHIPLAQQGAPNREARRAAERRRRRGGRRG